MSTNITFLDKAKPFIKWVGGKGQLLKQLSSLLPFDLVYRDKFDYHEPFVGGGAMLFFMLKNFPNIRTATINDCNKELITTYRIIRDNPNDLIELLRNLQTKYFAMPEEEDRRTFFLANRAKYNTFNLSSVEIAALFIFLNRTCFNGLYRVNAKGLFNVPFGRYHNPQICDEDTIYADSKLLQKVEIFCEDFETCLQKLSPNTFIYLDPPYRPLTQTASFTSYVKGGFDDDEQRRLASYCQNLNKNGHKWLLSNSDPHNSNTNDNFFDELYHNFEIHRVSAHRMVNSKADSRGKIFELAIRNYKE